MNSSQLFAFLENQPLLSLTIIAILVAVLSRMVQDATPRLGTALRNTGYLGLIAAFLLTVAQTARDTPRSDAAMLMTKPPTLTVKGRETVIPMSSDGHFWVEASVNGTKRRFLIDTGSTYMGLTLDTARQAGVTADPMQLPVELDTANGKVRARLGKIAQFRFGSIVAHDLNAAIAPDDRLDTNIIGMNLLSRLAKWKVEGNSLILVPQGQ